MKLPSLILLPLFSFSLLTSGVAEDDLPEPMVSWKYPPEMTVGRVEVYRTIGDVKLNAYVFEPKGHLPTDRCAAAVFFFGGGWKGGTPGQFLPQCLHLAERGMVAISVDYRVLSRHGVLPQECVKDAKAAIRWVRANAARLGVDPDRIVAGGGSAGGHLAAATALLPGFEDADHAGVSSMPNAMLLFNPAVVMAPVEGHPEVVTAEKLADISERCDGRPLEVSPYHFVRAGLPPSIIFQGMNDEAVPFPSVQLFHQAMIAAGNRCELKAYEGQPHGFFNPGRWKAEAGAGAKLHYYKTLAEVDAFLVSLDYLKPKPIHETFDADFDAKRFLTPIPNKNTEVRDGVMWTRGASGGKYPPMVYLPVAGKDLEISFRYRHLGDGGMVWFFVDGDDGFGSVDHMLRVKLLRNGVQLEVDAHSMDPNHPMRQNTGRPADPVSKAFRLNEFLPVEEVDLKANAWHEVKLVFRGENARLSIDDQLWTKELRRANFNAAKRKLLWMQNGGEAGIEIDDVRVEGVGE